MPQETALVERPRPTSGGTWVIEPLTIVAAPAPNPSAPTTTVPEASPPHGKAEAVELREPPAPAPPPSLLADEVAALREARAALGAGQPSRALAALAAHEQRFPHGLLGIEAEVLRIEALAQAGDASAARTRAQRFVAAHPNTPYARRVQVHAGDALKPEERANP